MTRLLGAAVSRVRVELTRKALKWGAAAVLFGLMGAAFQPVSLRADTIDDVLAKFATDRFPDTEKAIQDLASSGLATGPAMLEALAASQLYFDPISKGVFLKDSSGALIAARTGVKADGVPEARLKKVRMNNSVRGAMQTAQGALSLMSPDPAKRLSAAESVFKSRDPASLPLVQMALEAEKDARIRGVFEQARASIIASDNSQDEIKRLDALDVIKDRGDQDAASLLSTIAASSNGRVKASAEDGARAIQSRLALWAHVQNIWYGLSLGSVLLLAAIGLAITFGVMGIINMAHGEMVMLGAYTTFVVQEWIRAHNPALFNYSLLIAIPLAFVFTGFIGVVIERTIIRFLYGRPLETLLATFGLSLMLQQAVRSIFGANNREVGAPAFMSGSFDFGPIAVTSGRMWIIVFAIAVFVGLLMRLRVTPFGLRMRAVTQNRRMASAMGIDTNRVDALAFGLGSGIAGIAGVALSQIDNVSPNLGQSYIIDSFMVVVFGGVGNLWGTLVAALSLGVANKFLEPIAGAVLGKILLLVFIILFIQKRPRGLFALKGRAVEA
jgi:urea transport system permease protein